MDFCIIHVPMYIETVPNRGSKPAILLREGKRQGKRVTKRTLANLTHWPEEKIEALRCVLRGDSLNQQGFTIERSLPHGHVQIVLGMIRKLEVDSLLASKPCRERNLVVAMIAQRLLNPCSKLATTRLWHTTTLASELGVADADENELYAAMSWLVSRQKRIENKLAKRHLSAGARVLFDISSSSYHGRSCPLAAYGYNRDGDKLPSIVYGLLTNSDGTPIAVDVYPGNTTDSKAVPDQVEKLRKRFKLERVVLVGDRGMLTQVQIRALSSYNNLGWISALRSSSIRKLIKQEAVQPDLLVQENIAEITSNDYPGERLIVCYNSLLAEDRRRTREELIQATEQALQKIAAEVKRRTKTPLSADEIGVKAGKVLNRYKMSKHFIFEISNNNFTFKRDTEKIKQEQQLDGIYIVRTNEKARSLSTDNAVRAYKSLAQVEQAFRCLKSVDIRIRPIHHRTEDHVRAHIFICVLAYYIEWYMRRALAPVLYEDEALAENRWTRHPVDKAKSSDAAVVKKQTKTTADGWHIHSFNTLLAEMSTLCQNTCRPSHVKTDIRFNQFTEPTPYQMHIFNLLGLKKP